MIAQLVSRIRGRAGKAHVNHKRIARGALWVGFFVLAAKSCVALREVAIAWRYGISGVVDAYQIGLTASTWLATTLVGVVSVVLVPRLVTLRANPPAHTRFASELNGAMLALAAAVGVATLLGGRHLADFLSAGLPADTREMAAGIAVLLAPAAFLILAAAHFQARLQARERYGYSFLEGMPALFVALLIVAMPGHHVVTPFVAGTLVGFALQLIWAGAMTARGDSPMGSVRLSQTSPEWRAIYGALLMMGFGQILITIALPIDQFAAASLGEGAVATLGYASRIVTLFTGLGSVVVARALLPVLSSAVAEGRTRLGAQQALKWGMLLFGLSAAGCLFLWAVAPLMIRLLFERGAFGASETAMVTEIFRYGLFQIPAVFGGTVLVQWMAAAGAFRFLLGATAASLAAKLILIWLLIAPLGLGGVVLSTAGMYLTTALIMAARVWRDSRRGATD